MLTVNFVNDGTEKELPDVIGHYDYVVLVNGKKIAYGRLEDYNRLNGWQGLIRYLAKTLEEKGLVER